jgi:hypothetical protein
LLAIVMVIVVALQAAAQRGIMAATSNFLRAAVMMASVEVVSLSRSGLRIDRPVRHEKHPRPRIEEGVRQPRQRFRAGPVVQPFVLSGSPPSTMSVPRLRHRHPREIVVLQAFGERVRAGFVAGARASLLILCALAFDPFNVVKDAPSQRNGEQDRYHASSHAGNPPLGDNGWVPSMKVPEKILDSF